jgi:hypothetical protein
MKNDIPVIDLPVRGIWKLLNSPGHARFAFDLVMVNGNSHQTLRRSRLRHMLGDAHVDHSYSWTRPVFAPISGALVRVHDGSPDRQQLSLLRDLWAMLTARPNWQPGDISLFAGNHIMIHNAGLYIFLAHLQCGSLQVAAGDRVEAGQLLARVGNSGFTLEPHLHLQLFDQIDNPLTATAPQFLVSKYERWTGQRWDLACKAVLQKGELIRSVGSDGPLT